MIDHRVLQQKFFSDPDWIKIEELLKSFIEPLVDMNQLDFNESATQFKADAKSARRLYESISKFLQDTQIISRPLQEIKNPFK